MRKAHRWIAVFAVLIALYISLTGIAIQSIDLAALLRHAPATDSTVQAMREGIDGPPNFRVIVENDYAAPALPSNFSFDLALTTLLAAGHQKLGAAPISFVEFRMADGAPVGQLLSKKLVYRFDAASGRSIGNAVPYKLLPLSTPSLRGTIKSIHRMRVYGAWGVAADAVAGLVMVSMIITGLLLYLELYRARARMKRKSVYWFGGNWWRTLHRGISVTASLLLLWVAVTGTILAISSIGVATYVTLYGPERPGMTIDASRPLADAELPAMLNSTLRAFRSANGDEPIKVIRLRYFAGMPQGLVVAGTGQDTQQTAYNTATGRWASFHEPGYPVTGQTFGWQVDETVKELHRGDYFGLTGRWLSLLTGFALLYLAVSGAIMYLELWNRRRSKGKRMLFW
jgi:uncharacterized iron-regulated membrane protein